jgi:2'-5' RNA ligase
MHKDENNFTYLLKILAILNFNKTVAIKMYEDYLMLLSPPESVKYEISRYKRASRNIIGQYKSVYSPAHITIQNLYRQKAFAAEPAILAMEKKLTTMLPIFLIIDGFDYFDHGGKSMTIYARIKSTPATTMWFGLLKKNINSKISFNPHITIARDIPAHDFYKLWPKFTGRKIIEPFLIDKLTITRRETYGYDSKWKFYKDIYFKKRFKMV